MKALEKIQNGITLDVQYEEEDNQLDVFSDCNWTDTSKEGYEAKEDFISSYEVTNELCTVYLSYDVSGYEYWVIQQEETNYTSINIDLKKSLTDYADDELETIQNLIVETNDIIVEKLMND